MKVKTHRFGEIEVSDQEVVTFPEGIFGFSDHQKFCLIDSGDETLILWLQSLTNPAVSFPVLEPKIFKSDYSVKLSAQELKHLQLTRVSDSIVLSILTIPREVTEMSANLKAPVVVNLKNQIGRQVVLQENEYSIKHMMFKELKAQLLTIQSNSRAEASRVPHHAVNIRALAPATHITEL